MIASRALLRSDLLRRLRPALLGLRREIITASQDIRVGHQARNINISRHPHEGRIPAAEHLVRAFRVGAERILRARGPHGFPQKLDRHALATLSLPPRYHRRGEELGEMGRLALQEACFITARGRVRAQRRHPN